MTLHKHVFEDNQSPLQCKPEISYQTRTAKRTEQTLPKPKIKLFRTKSEGRNKQILSTRCKKVKLTTEYWTSKQIINFFRQKDIQAHKTDWFIHLNTPHRKLTQADQLEIFNQPDSTEHLVHFNINHKHFIIETLNGND